MLTTRHFALALSAIILAAGAGTAPAYADGPAPVDCTKTPTDPSCDVHAGTPSGPGSGPQSGGGGGRAAPVCHYPESDRVVPCSLPEYGQLADDGCYYKVATGDDLGFAEALSGKPLAPGRWYVGVCGYPPIVGYTRYRVFGGVVQPKPADLAADAVKKLHLPLPAIRVSPAPPAAQLVFLPTWLWLDGSSWGSRSATASVPGLSVTAIAKPVKLVFTTGDGASVSCPGPGSAWTGGQDPDAASPDCGHTYQRPGLFSVTATVTWQISWAGGGQTGTVPDPMPLNVS